jgi:hypothetical protein
MRSRLEDFGRLAEKLNNIMDSDIFEAAMIGNIEKENLKEKLQELSYKLEDLHCELGKCWEIATGQDFLNEGQHE